MSLGVYNSQFKTGIDTSVLKEVSQEILKRAAEKNNQFNVNSSSVSGFFKSADLGLDLYKGNVDSQTARQIAMNNSGLQIQLNQNVMQSIQYLNAKAAQNIQKNVEGKITVALNEGVGNARQIDETPKFNSIVSLSTGKDKNGSNTAYRGELLFVKKEDEKTDEIGNNIFA